MLTWKMVIFLFSYDRRLGGNQLKQLPRNIFKDLSALEKLWVTFYNFQAPFCIHYLIISNPIADKMAKGGKFLKKLWFCIGAGLQKN